MDERGRGRSSRHTTNKVAAEMRERAGFPWGDDAWRMWVSTFHWRVRLLRYEHEAIRRSRSTTRRTLSASSRWSSRHRIADIKRFTPEDGGGAHLGRGTS